MVAPTKMQIPKGSDDINTHSFTCQACLLFTGVEQTLQKMSLLIAISKKNPILIVMILDV